MLFKKKLGVKSLLELVYIEVDLSKLEEEQ